MDVDDFWNPETHHGLLTALLADVDGDGRADLIEPVVSDGPDIPRTQLRWYFRRNVAPSESDEDFADREGGDLVTEGPRKIDPGQLDPLLQVRVVSTDGMASQLLTWDEPQGRYRLIDLHDGELRERTIDLPFMKVPENEWGDRRNLQFADINGDGLEDAIYPASGLSYQLSSGLGFSDIRPRGASPYRSPELPGLGLDLAVRIADFTGDGADDILLLHPGIPDGDDDFEHGLQLYSWRAGVGFTGFRSARPPYHHSTQRTGRPFNRLISIRMGCWTFSRFGGTTGGPQFLRILRRKPEAMTGDALGTRPDKLIRVKVFNMGQRVEVAYGALGGLATRNPHTPCADAYPLVCPRRGGSIVSRHTVENLDETGAGHRFYHSYVGARVDALGAGWLGFSNTPSTTPSETSR